MTAGNSCRSPRSPSPPRAASMPRCTPSSPGRKAPPPRQILRPPLRHEIRERRVRRRFPPPHRLRRDRPCRLHRRIHGMRRRVPRLRQRRLAGHPAAHRPPLRRAIRPTAPPSASTTTIATAHSPMSPRNRAWAAASGPTGITVADYDNDGFDDIFITCWGQNILFHNNGNGTFTDVTEKAGLIQPRTRFGTGCTWVDYDRDGQLDLFVSHYMVFDPAKIPRAARIPAATIAACRSYCGPQRHAAGDLPPLPQQRRRHLHGCEREGRHLHRQAAATASPPWPPISMATAGPISMSPATPLPACCSATIMTARSRNAASKAASR